MKLSLMDLESILHRTARRLNTLKEIKEINGGDTFIEQVTLKDTYEAMIIVKSLLEGGEQYASR